MTAQTSRYGIKYPTGGDLVSNIPQHMQQAAQSIESALADVDDRHTTAAYSPVVRPTFYLLNQVRPQPGQIGIVTAEPKETYNHYYIGTKDGTWAILYANTTAPALSKTVQLPIASVEWKMPFSNDKIRITRMGQMVFMNGSVKFNNAGQVNHQRMNETIPQGYRPAYNNATAVTAGNTYITLICNRDGSVTFLGDPRNQYCAIIGTWVTDNDWPTA